MVGRLLVPKTKNWPQRRTRRDEASAVEWPPIVSHFEGWGCIQRMQRVIMKASKLRNTFPLSCLMLFAAAQAAATELRFEENGVADQAIGGWVYNPTSRKSVVNASVARIDTGYELATDLKQGDSFTAEAFARPDHDLATQPRDFLPVFQSLGEASYFVAGIRRSPAPHSYNWWQASIGHPSQRPTDLAGGRYGGIGMVRNNSPWRHVAFTWDADTRTASFFLDYQLQATTELAEKPEWDVSRLLVGGRRSEKTFQGWIDEVRVTAKALPPWEFLRRSQVELSDVSFAPEIEPMLPSDYGHVDVRLHYGAVGDGKHDDTEAIHRAFSENENRVPIEYRTVYFPAGTYLISDSIRFSRFMVVRGAGKGKTIIKLKDRAEGFDQTGVPKPAFAVGYDWPYTDRPKKNRAGNVIGNYIFDLTIDTGKKNPSALGLDFHCNNHGCVENVEIISGDGSGLVGLDFKRGWPGPCLIKNVHISGFDLGISAAHREYSLVFSGIHLSGQNEAAIDNGGNVLSLENVVSENSVPAVRNRAGGLVTMINSKLIRGASGNVAIESDSASVYLRNIEVDGYGVSVRETRRKEGASDESLARLTERTINEYYTGPVDQAFESEQGGSLKLPIKQTPEISYPSVDQWVNICDYENLVVEGDWSPAIQAAVDASKPVVYFPAGVNYRIKSDVTIRGAVRTFFGGSPKARVDNGQADDPGNGPALVLGDDLPEFQFDMLGSSHVVHRSSTKLVFRHCGTDHVTAGKDCGDTFIEDTGGKLRISEHQRIWARQLNPETKGIPEIINNGGQLWALGLKTEYLSTKIENRGGARTEILGGLMYPVHPVTDESLPMFLNEDSDISLVHAVSVYKKNHEIYMKDTQGGEAREHRDWRWVSGRPISNLYRSVRPAKTTANDRRMP